MIPVSKPDIREEDINAVVEVLKSGRLSLGPKLKEFEDNFKDLIGTKYAIAVNSGTSGLHLCMKSLNLKKGDEVITTPFSFISSANCVLYEGAKPVFVDVDDKTFNIDVNQIEKKINEKTKAILPVHVFGHPCDMKEILRLSDKYNLDIVEDACESIGSAYNGRKVGTFGRASVFAFYPNKQMTTGEGGMICTNSQRVYNLCKSLRDQGRTDSGQWFSHDYLGYNYRLNDMSCALGVSQLKRFNDLIKERKKLANLYNDLFSDICGLVPPYVENYADHSWFVYVVKLDKHINRDKLILVLNRKGVQTRPYFPAIHLQPLYKSMFGYKEGVFPITERLSQSSLALPFFVGLSEDDVHNVYKEIKNALKLVGGNAYG